MNPRLFFFIGAIIAFSCNPAGRFDLPDPAEFYLSWEFIENDPEQDLSRATFVIKNNGKQTLDDSNWMLYFNQMGTGVVSGSVTGNVTIDHLNGDLLRIIPVHGFTLKPGDSVEIGYARPGRLIKENEVPSGPYFVFTGRKEGMQKAYAIENYSVHPFPPLERVFPPQTGIPLPDARWIYEQNLLLREIPYSLSGRIIPTPVQAEFNEGRIILNPRTRIHFQPGLRAEAGYLAEILEKLMGVKLIVEENISKGHDIILLKVTDEAYSTWPEGYSLGVDPVQGILIEGGSNAGVFYGIQSLLALLPVEYWKEVSSEIGVASVEIMDHPAFPYRGIMLDVARNFHRPETIRRLIDIMGFYKMNRLHLSLTNDEGWRIEIPALPELTEVGGFRGHSWDGTHQLIPAYGSGPDAGDEDNMGSGYLTREEFVELLRYAQKRHIQVIPEINFPGHARAAIRSMEARYERLTGEGDPQAAEEYRLIDPGDHSIYNSAQNFNDNVVCVCMEAPYHFFKTVVEELAGMYREAGLELHMIHSGGDEVPAGAWAGSPLCNSFLQSHPKIGGVTGLQAYFEGRLLEILSGMGIAMGGWEEVALRRDTAGRWAPNIDFLDKAIIPYVWNSLDDNLDLGNRMANAGFQVVLCNVDNFYLDLAYTHHPAEPGHYWGGFVNTRRAFEFIPFNPFYSTLTDRYRRPFGNEKRFDGLEPLDPGARKNIAGLQGQLWSETVRGSGMLEYYYLPKMIGLAERAWSGQADWGELPDLNERVEAINKSWNDFAYVIGRREMPRLDYLFGGYAYRLPPPGAVIREGMLYANVDFPGLPIRYSTDGTVPGIGSSLYAGPVAVNGPVSLRTFDTRGRGSRVTVLEPAGGY